MAKKLKTSDRVVFGEYISYQDKNKNSEFEPLEWQVLDCVGSKALLLSFHALDFTKPSNLKWQNSPIRRWLNEEFLQQAFTEEEQDLIFFSKIESNDDYSKFLHSIPDDAHNYEIYDQLFLLSIKDVNLYLSSYDNESFEQDPLRQSTVTSYARMKGAFVFALSQYERGRRQYRVYGHLYPVCGKTIWGLRDKYCIDHFGHIISCPDQGYAIKPAMWVDLSKCSLIREAEYYYQSDRVTLAKKDGAPYRVHEDIPNNSDELPF